MAPISYSTDSTHIDNANANNNDNTSHLTNLTKSLWSELDRTAGISRSFKILIINQILFLIVFLVLIGIFLWLLRAFAKKLKHKYNDFRFSQHVLQPPIQHSTASDLNQYESNFKLPDLDFKKKNVPSDLNSYEHTKEFDKIRKVTNNKNFDMNNTKNYERTNATETHSDAIDNQETYAQTESNVINKLSDGFIIDENNMSENDDALFGNTPINYAKNRHSSGSGIKLASPKQPLSIFLDDKSIIQTTTSSASSLSKPNQTQLQQKYKLSCVKEEAAEFIDPNLRYQYRYTKSNSYHQKTSNYDQQKLKYQEKSIKKETSVENIAINGPRMKRSKSWDPNGKKLLFN